MEPSTEPKRRRDDLISQMRKVQYFAGTTSIRREKIVFKRLALPVTDSLHVVLPVTDSLHVQGRSSSQVVAMSPPKYGQCRIRIRMYVFC